jgi:uncharacterized membrane protein (DUF2068 family)
MLVDFIVGVAVTAFGVLIIAFALWVGAFFVILGVLSLAVGYGLRKARSWARLLGLWAGVVYIVFGVLLVQTLPGIGSIVFGGVSIYYFNRADLKRYLGKVRP